MSTNDVRLPDGGWNSEWRAHLASSLARGVTIATASLAFAAWPQAEPADVLAAERVSVSARSRSDASNDGVR